MCGGLNYYQVDKDGNQVPTSDSVSIMFILKIHFLLPATADDLSYLPILILSGKRLCFILIPSNKNAVFKWKFQFTSIKWFQKVDVSLYPPPLQ